MHDAKRLAEIISDTKKVSVDAIPIKSIREGEIIGDHKVVFDSETETIELLHSAKSRDTFALGAITAAKFISRKKSGLFTMQDVLNNM